MKKSLNFILCAILCVSITGCSSSITNTSSTSTSSEVNNISKNDNFSLKLTNGTFKVGEDLDAGEYVLIKNDNEFMGSYEITKDTTGDSGSTVDFDSFENFDYIKVQDGQYIQLDKCTLYIPSELGNKLDFSDKKELTCGMFRVGNGKDIEPGEYKLEITKNDSDVQGWYCLYNSLDGGYDGGPDLQDSDFFSGSKLLTLQEGQYIKLDSNTKIVK